MVVDSSALVAILLGEPEREAFLERLTNTRDLLISAATLVETAIVVFTRRAEHGDTALDELIREQAIEIVPVGVRQAAIARTAFALYGKGRHPAGLNFGDCFSYALAKATKQPLLFKGDDFAHTDIESAIPAR